MLNYGEVSDDVLVQGARRRPEVLSKDEHTSEVPPPKFAYDVEDDSALDYYKTIIFHVGTVTEFQINKQINT